LVSATRAELSSLPESAFLAEPRARNTAPCIAWAARVIARSDPDAIVCVLPSDQHASNPEEFQRVLSRAASAAAGGIITTIGIVPTRPETGYGYIKRAALHDAGVYAVDRFVEKPNFETAQKYVESGDYFWNAGIFVFRARDMVAAVDEHLPKMKEPLDALSAARGTGAEKERVEEFFATCEAVSVDYGIMEKAEKLLVVPGDFGWSDLGSWESAWELSQKDEAGNAAPKSAVLVDAHNNLVEDLRTKSVGGRVIALVGVDDLCIVETDDALLVMPRSRSQDVREVVESLKKTDREDLI
jgi:mannose-1-phosphate guanylyltransferase